MKYKIIILDVLLGLFLLTALIFSFYSNYYEREIDNIRYQEMADYLNMVGLNVDMNNDWINYYGEKILFNISSEDYMGNIKRNYQDYMLLKEELENSMSSTSKNIPNYLNLIFIFNFFEKLFYLLAFIIILITLYILIKEKKL